ncbi:MAG: flagellar biosynthesis anti-sigma factor FlgM [Clostridiales bacterium]|jgi:negative regulator of flagellin synthesis FlgM|nr:flagellar biosynthesis anti-sigma factor FlgM [Clostridiales bacterium]
MKINNVMRTYQVQRPDKPASSERVSRAEERTDMVTLSTKARDFSAINKVLADTPDIRADKVQNLKAQIDAGTYNVSGMDVANKLFAQLG